ncbi:MAG: 4-hydroxythreonine-4-phosphate dehydrogenase PdxA [Firmicutes bacterium]|mgnify:CR=1 FL=1|nr:4-hydroxythreonine-4-phosphate dehydrogenase PdxA [Bacillota bacterium]
MLGTRPVIGVLLGDPTGIGPELVAKLVADRDLWDLAQTVIIGDQRIFAMGQKIAQTDSDVPIFSTYEDICFPLEQPVLLDLPTVDPAELELAKVDTRAGKSVYDTLLYTIDLAKQGKIDGFVFAPFNKAALHACGCPFETELDLFKNEFNRPEVRGELNVVEDAWNARVTSHVALKDVTSLITVQSVYETISFVNQVLKVYGKEVPKLAVSGLNPHCGEDGLFGTEEGDVIAPAIEKAREEGIDVSGPFPCDTIWLKVLAGEYDAVVSMYHDQGQIALKLLGFDKGVTVHGGLPVPIATPAHGTAFDIAGQGKANAQGIKRAFTIAGRMAANQKSNS